MRLRERIHDLEHRLELQTARADALEPEARRHWEGINSIWRHEHDRVATRLREVRAERDALLAHTQEEKSHE